MRLLFVTNELDLEIEQIKLLPKLINELEIDVCHELSITDSSPVYDLWVIETEGKSERELLEFVYRFKHFMPNSQIWFLTTSLNTEENLTYLQSGVDNIITSKDLGGLCLRIQQFLRDHQNQDSAAPYDLMKQSYFIFQALIENATDVIWAKNLNGSYQFINEAGAEFLGKPVDKIIGNTDKSLFEPDTYARIRSTDIEVINSKKSNTVEFELNSVGGEKAKYYLAMKAPYKNLDGQVEGLVGIVRDITVKKKLTDELLKAKMEAEEANLQRSTFFANITHELRTPLHNVITSSNIALNGILGELDPTTLSYFSLINSNGKHLLTLIDQLLDIASFESGKHTIQIDDIHLNELLEDSSQLVQSLLKQKNQTLDIQVSSTMPSEFRTDKMKIIQVLCNLLSNAHKFSGPNTTIKLISYREDQFLCFAVVDQGAGISPDIVSRIFKPFEVPQKNNQAIRGTGLGLPLSKYIIDSLDGHIELNTKLEEGSTFVVKIPYQRSRKREDTVQYKKRTQRDKHLNEKTPLHENYKKIKRADLC